MTSPSPIHWRSRWSTSCTRSAIDRPGECVLVDPAYAVDELVEVVGDDGMTVTGALVDPLPPRPRGWFDDGPHDRGHRRTARACRVPDPRASRRDRMGREGDRGHAPTTWSATSPATSLTVGGVEISLVHTPGHTPGSQCFFVEGRLVAGDTLFLEGCGRTDLPGSDPPKMIESLRRARRGARQHDPVPRPPLLDRQQRHHGRRQADQLHLPVPFDSETQRHRAA